MCRQGLRSVLKSANISSHGTGGSVRKAHCSYLRITACGVVSTIVKIRMYFPINFTLKCIESDHLLFSFFNITLLLIATRETAFVHAISAAGVMYTLTKNCSMGDFDNCGCDDSKIGKTGKTLLLLTMNMYN